MFGVRRRKREADIGLLMEQLLDILVLSAADTDDDDLVFLGPTIKAMARACNVDPDLVELEPMMAGELRRRARDAKTRLANGDTGAQMRSIVRNQRTR